MKLFKDKVALITGGGSGIGLATAVQFAREGAKVVVSNRTEKTGEEAARSIRAEGGKALFVRADVSVPRDCEKLVQKTLEAYGQLDAAFNNAGIGGEMNAVVDYSLAGWNEVIGTNLSGIFYCMKYEIPHLLKKGGSIVNMSSVLGQVGFGPAPGYSAAKHGVVGLTQDAALEYSSRGLRVNAVGPGFVETPMIAPVTSDKTARDHIVSLHPIGRLGRPEEVAELVVWLSSEKASFITGSYYPVDGGYLAR